MAAPIKVTPVLSGQSSKKFNERLASPQNQKANAAEKERINSLFQKVMSKSK